jgi:hypothetical protein
VAAALLEEEARTRGTRAAERAARGSDVKLSAWRQAGWPWSPR